MAAKQASIDKIVNHAQIVMNLDAFFHLMKCMEAKTCFIKSLPFALLAKVLEKRQLCMLWQASNVAEYSITALEAHK